MFYFTLPQPPFLLDTTKTLPIMASLWRGKVFVANITSDFLSKQNCP